MKKIKTSFLFFLIASAAAGAIPRKEMLSLFEKRLTALMDQDAWKSYAASHPWLFRPVNKENPISVVVEKEKLEIGEQGYGIGIGYLQVFAEAPLEQFRTVLEETQYFQALYDLDRSAFWGPPKEDGSFEAHIYKRVPLLPNQDYVLFYKSLISGPFWFQRASLVEDKTDFGLRDNLRMLEPVDGGTIYREIGILYPLIWTVRAMGPTLRDIMRKELLVMGKRLKCAAETPPPWDEEKARDC